MKARESEGLKSSLGPGARSDGLLGCARSSGWMNGKKQSNWPRDEGKEENDEEKAKTKEDEDPYAHIRLGTKQDPSSPVPPLVGMNANRHSAS